MNYNFTDRVRKVLAMAREEAIRLQHDYVGTEHILLGLIREGEGVAAAVLTNLSVDLEQSLADGRPGLDRDVGVGRAFEREPLTDHRTQVAGDQQAGEMIGIDLVGLVSLPPLASPVADDDPIYHRRQEVVQPLRLRPFLEHHLDRAPQPDEEREQR